MNVTSVLMRLEPHQENWLSALCSQKGLRGIPRSHFTDGKPEAHSSWMTELAVAGLALESCVSSSCTLLNFVHLPAPRCHWPDAFLLEGKQAPLIMLLVGQISASGCCPTPGSGLAACPLASASAVWTHYVADTPGWPMLLSTDTLLLNLV